MARPALLILAALALAGCPPAPSIDPARCSAVGTPAGLPARVTEPGMFSAPAGPLEFAAVHLQPGPQPVGVVVCGAADVVGTGRVNGLPLLEDFDGGCAAFAAVVPEGQALFIEVESTQPVTVGVVMGALPE